MDSAVDLRAHEVNKHRVTYSPIPQNDGACDLDARQPTYCKICEECPEEMKTSEDVNYHVMNNHATNLVYEKYGKLWVEKRRYCISDVCSNLFIYVPTYQAQAATCPIVL